MKKIEDYTLGDINKACSKIDGNCAYCEKEIEKICHMLDRSPETWKLNQKNEE